MCAVGGNIFDTANRNRAPRLCRPRDEFWTLDKGLRTVAANAKSQILIYCEKRTLVLCRSE